MKEAELLREKAYLYWLCQIPSLGAVTLRKLWEVFGCFSVLFNIEETQLKAQSGLSATQCTYIREWKKNFDACRREYETLSERGIRFITPLDPCYPSRLRQLYDYPMGLYIRGQLPREDRPAVSIVGARSCTSYGRQVAEEFASVLANEQIPIISGLAAGIDGAAHRGALNAGQPTFGVLGCGVNICYPSTNYSLYETMIGCGGIVSEFPLGRKPSPGHFPMRNRIISGLSDIIVIVEAKERSGSLITAELGLEQGKEIFAVPGRITDCLSIGCNQLIGQGAGVALSPGDILEYIGIKHEKKLILQEKNRNGLAKKEKIVYSCLDLKPKHLDEIAMEAKLDLRECMGILFDLVMSGYAVQSANYYYEKNIQN